MLNIYCPTIEPATDEHAPWYSNFTSAFLFCQITNRLLLSYLESYIKEITAKQWEGTEEFKQACRNRPKTPRFEIACDLDIEDFLNQIIQNLPHEEKGATHFLMSMGLEISGFYDDSHQININELKKKVPDDGWHKTIKGLLNCYEFGHLASIVEQALKVATSNNTADGIVSSALRRNPALCTHLEDQWGVSRDFIVKTWDLYRHVRNLYAHAFGFMDIKNIEQILEAKKKFVKAIDSLASSWHLLPFDVDTTIFPSKRCIAGEMYLLNDEEMNVFRNFVRIFMPALAKIPA